MDLEQERITYFAETDSRNKRVRFGIKAKDRTRHMYVIGKTGMGKSTLLENLAIQDIQNGSGLAVIDPHGSFADKLLDYVPEHRMKDVIYFAPFDMDYPISFNVMEDVGADKRHLVANGLMSAFKKIWVDAWSARMEYILNNTILALLEYPDSTLIGVNRMLSDKEYRKKVVDYITDPSVKSFWTDEFANYTERMAAEATPAIQNKIGQFISNPVIRNIIGQPKSSFDFREAMDTKKIVIINLSKGRIGEASAQLLGSIIVTKIYLAAMSRADLDEKSIKESPNFYLFVDEFQSFANESFADILSEARKYKLNLTIAHQYIEQMPEEVRSAVFGNVGTMITFRVGALDAEVLEKEFAPKFMGEDLVNLGFAQIYLKLMIDGVSSQPFSASTIPPLPRPDISYREQIIENSRITFAEPRDVVEEAIKQWHQEGRVEPKQKGEKSFDKKFGNNKDRGGHDKGWQERSGQDRSRNDSHSNSHSSGQQFSNQKQTNSHENDNRNRGGQGNHGNHNNQGNQGNHDSHDNQSSHNHHSNQNNHNNQNTKPQFKKNFSKFDSVKNENQQRRERELREAISLSSLKRSDDEAREKKKEMSQENADALKSLLGKVIGENKISQDESQTEKASENRQDNQFQNPSNQAVNSPNPSINPSQNPSNPSSSEKRPKFEENQPKSIPPINPPAKDGSGDDFVEIPRPVLEKVLKLDEDGTKK